MQNTNNSSSLVTVRLFKDTPKIPATIERPLKIRTQEDKETWVKTLYKQGWQDPKNHILVSLDKIHEIESIGVVVTKDILVIDFDTDASYSKALEINSILPEHQQCGFIVHSSRKGGHFYYKNEETIKDNTTTIKISPLHSGKEVTTLDVLEGISHNAFAPTQGDGSKTPLSSNTNILTPIPDIMVYYINSIVLEEAKPSNKAIYLVSKEGYSDDNYQLAEAFILYRDPLFLEFYGLPQTMPAGESYKTLQSLAYRLLRDETIDHQTVISALDRYDPEHRQDHNALCPIEENRYIESKKAFSLSVTSRQDKTPATAYLDKVTGNYIVVEQSKEQPIVRFITQESKVKVLLESISGQPRGQLKMHRVQPVTAEYTYLKPGGLDIRTYSFNTAYINNYLKAFKGTMPDNYTTTNIHKLIDLLKYMWGENYTYLLASTQYRLKTFEHSAVVTHIVGGEGSGKGLTVNILTRAFTEESQELSYELFMDKHSTHQIQPNTILEEVGEWNPSEQKGALAKIKAMSGSRGKATVRGMHKEAVVVPTINKIWVLGNNWMRLHTDPMTQRRIHAVYMPQSLTKELGGRYTAQELDELLTDSNILDLYYWLGNEYQPETQFTATDYHSAVSQHGTESYSIYLDNVEGDSDKVIKLLTQRDYKKLIAALGYVNADLDATVWKLNKQHLLVVSLSSLKLLFGQLSGAPAIHKALDSIASNFEGNKLLKFNNSPEKYTTIYNSPQTLGEEKLLQGGA